MRQDRSARKHDPSWAYIDLDRGFAAVEKAGFQKGGLIVALAGISGRHTESEVIGLPLQRYAAGERVRTTVLRGDQRVDLGLPIQ